MHISRRDLLAASAVLPFSLPACAQQPAASGSRFGINLSGPPADWNAEQAFVNVFRMSRPWISQANGAQWGKGPPLDLDEHGWVRRLERGSSAETLICNINGGHYPGGRYTVLFDGDGDIAFTGRARRVSRDPGRIVIDVDSNGGFGLRIDSTDPDDYIRNIRVMMPGFEDATDADPFRPDFLERWRGVAALRFMDWMDTNNSEIASWSERPTARHATFAERGVDVETMVRLANELDAEPWFCMPHLADDDYVRNFARVVAEQLNPHLRAWVEYSNEVWNAQFRQHRDAARRAEQLGISGESWVAAWRYTGYRSKQIFDLWESEFGGTERLVRVLASQAPVPFISEQVLGFRDAYKSADVLAIAPYITCIAQPSGDGLTVATAEKWSVDQALDYVEQRSLPSAIEWMDSQKAVADRHGLKLAAYEAGQHLVGVLGAENNEAITNLFKAANAHPRMGDIYRRYYEAWERIGGDLLCAFNSVDSWSKFGSWGLMQYTDDDPAASPKYAASVAWARELGQSMREL